MGNHAPRPIEADEQARADAMWNGFVKGGKITIIGTIVALVLMALFLL